MIEDELEAYGAGLDDKPRLIALNKIDLVDRRTRRASFRKELKDAGADRVFPISGATGEGLDALLDAVLEHLPAATMTERPAGEREEADDTPVVAAVRIAAARRCGPEVLIPTQPR